MYIVHVRASFNYVVHVHVCVTAQVSSLHTEVESKAEDNTSRNMELEQLRRQLHQFQTSSEVHLYVHVYIVHVLVLCNSQLYSISQLCVVTQLYSISQV